MPNIPKRFLPEPFEYHQEIELRIDTLTNLGLGLGRINDWVVMVPFALPGELVLARVFRNHKNYSDADLVKVLEPSSDRVEPRCELFGRCGGCQYQNLRYEAQLDWKRNQVLGLLQHMAGIEDVPVDAVIPSPKLYGYRSKITPHFQKPRSGDVGAIGFLHHAKRFDIIDVKSCPIASVPLNETLSSVRDHIRKTASAFKKGATLLLRESTSEKVLTKSAEICEETVSGLRFRFPAGDFFQNNPSILPDFVAHVLEEAQSLGSTQLVDAYCGSGLFGLSCASGFKTVVGIEVSETSIRWAKENARLNQITNASFHLGTAELIFEHLQQKDSDQTVVIIDPPRKGCSGDFLDQLFRFAPAGVVYVSCNPATQMRDLVRFRESGYELSRVQPFDLFPQTRHLECVMTLSKVNR